MNVLFQVPIYWRYLPYISDYPHAEIPSDSLKQSFVESHGGLFTASHVKFAVTHKKWTV